MIKAILGLFKKNTFKAKLMYQLTFNILKIVAIFSLIIIFLNLFMLSSVPTPSMESTIEVGDKIFVVLKGYKLDRGDIIYFRMIDENGISTKVAKRLIGLPGDTIEVINTTLYINGDEIYEPYLNSIKLDSHVVNYNYPKLVIPEGEYFVMGDNRELSYDSRDFGTIKRDAIKGEIKHIFKRSN